MVGGNGVLFFFPFFCFSAIYETLFFYTTYIHTCRATISRYKYTDARLLLSFLPYAGTYSNEHRYITIYTYT